MINKVVRLTKEYKYNQTEIQNNQSSNNYDKNMNKCFIKENTPINKWRNEIRRFDNMKKNNYFTSDNVKQSIAINSTWIMSRLEQILYIQHCIV